jgi:hypothetical protein
MRNIALVTSALCLVGCASQPSMTYWQKDKKHHVIVVHHVTRSKGRIHDRTEELSTKIMTPAEVAVYDIGRLPDGHGGMSEAHRYYRVVQSEHFDLRLPEAGKTANGGPTKPTGPKRLFYAPTYTPPTKDERITDAVNRATQREKDAVAAKQQLDQATNKVTERLSEDNTLRSELENQMEANEELKRQIDKGVDGSFSTHHGPATANPTPPANDPLASWGASISNQP